MANYCVIKDDTKVVMNKIIWNGSDKFTYPDIGYTLVESAAGQIGDKYENGTFMYEDVKDPEKPVWIAR
jgi:hypothetical protein